jgi:uracil phosphoribosyltransferase
MPLTLVRHAVLEDVLARLRDKATPPEAFRRLSRRAALVLAVEATRDLPAAEATVETPLERCAARRLERAVVAVPVLRAGLGLLEGFLEVVPEARVGHFGLERDEATAVARCYYEKLPDGLGEATVFVLDPMLATGGSAAETLARLAERGARDARLLSVVAAPEGVAHVEARAPGTRIVAAALDRGLNERKFILPGLGDYGDRLHAT